MRKKFLVWAKEEHQVETLEGLPEAKLAQLQGGYIDYMAELLEDKSKLDKDAIEDLVDEIKNKSDERDKTYKELFAKLGQTMEKFIQGSQTPKAQADFNKKVDSAIEDYKKKKEEGFKGEVSLKLTAEDAIAMKATVTAGSIVNNTDAFRISEIGQLAFRLMVLYEFFNKIPVGENSNGVVRYSDWDDATKVRAAIALAEGALFPESTAAWEEFSINMRKIGDTIKVTEESMVDRARFVAELNRFLDTNVRLVIDQQLYDGDGVAPNILGVNTTAPTYVPVPAAIQDANIFDLIRKMRTAIAKGKRSKYMPNVCMMNADDIDRMLLKKDADNNYVRPDFFQISDFGTNVYIVSGVLIIETNVVTPNTMLVGDGRFAAIYEEGGFDIQMGLNADDFSRDLRTLKARKRLLMLVRNIDQDAWLKSINITNDLLTLAS